MSNKDYRPAEFYKVTIKDGNYDDEIVGEDIRYMIKDGKMNMYHNGTPMALNRKVTPGEKIEIRVREGEHPSIIGENCVPNMLPQVPLSDSTHYRSSFYNALSESTELINSEENIVNESMEDKIYNTATKVNIGRSIRAQLIKVLKLEEKLAKAEAVNKETPAAKNNTADIKREVVHERKKLNSLKNTLTDEEKKEFKKIEKIATSEIKKEEEKNESVEESTTVKNTIEKTNEVVSVETEESVENPDDEYIKDISEKAMISYEEASSLWENYSDDDDIMTEGLYDNITKGINDVKKKKIDELNKDIKRANIMKKHFTDKANETGNKEHANKAQGYRMKAKRLGIKRSELIGDVKNHHDTVVDRVKKRNEKAKQPNDAEIYGSMLRARYAESVADLVSFEAANMEDEIKDIVAKFNEKGYEVKYASPGHINLRKKEDKEPDGVYYGKLYSDGRVMFKENYGLSKFSAPENWKWREVDGCDYLDAIDKPYKDSDGTPNEAFKKFKDDALASLKEFVDKLPKKGSKEEPKEESVELINFTEAVEDIIDDIMNK